jgi:hypothetical protein
VLECKVGQTLLAVDAAFAIAPGKATFRRKVSRQNLLISVGRVCSIDNTKPSKGLGGVTSIEIIDKVEHRSAQ